MGLDVFGFDFYFVAVDDELSTEADGFTLQCEVDYVYGLIHLLLCVSVSDLIRVELKIDTANGDDLHLMQGRFQDAIFCSHSDELKVSISVAVM